MQVAIVEKPDLEHAGFGLPICFISPDKSVDLDEVIANIEKISEDKLPEYARPNELHFLECLPLTKVGKTDVKVLEKIAKKKRKYFSFLI